VENVRVFFVQLLRKVQLLQLLKLAHAAALLLLRRLLLLLLLLLELLECARRPVRIITYKQCLKFDTNYA